MSGIGTRIMTIRAIRVRTFGGPEVLRLEETPDLKPGPGEVLLRVQAAGVNPVESYRRSGTYARQPSLPWTPGTDGAGIVESVGGGVTRVRSGDRVFTTGSITGTYAERCLCRSFDVRPLPDRLDFPQGAAIHIPYATAARALLQKAEAHAGETVLIHGATGGVGLAAVQIARALGCEVIGTGGTRAGRELLSNHGVRHVLDHTAAGYAEALPAITGGRGVDVILEMLADRNLDQDLLLVATRGRVVIIGSRGRIEIEPRRAMTGDVAIFGLSLPNATEAEIDEVYAFLLPRLSDGTLAPVVRETIPLGEAARAHGLVMAPGALGKIVLVP